MPDPSLNTSFIPKQGGRGTRPAQKRARLGLPLLGTFLLLLLVIAAWVGIELYQNHLEGQIEERKQQLAAERASLETRSVDELLQSDSRMKLADKLLSRHIAPSHIFRELEDLTVAGLRYTSLSYKGSPGGSITVELEGEAHNFSTVVTQADAFVDSPFFDRVEFTDLNKAIGQNTRGVVFSAELTVPVSGMLYSTGITRAEVDTETVSGAIDGTQDNNDVATDESEEN
ncbi:MAG: PilN domain-containing protein [Candidatus Paceibacterota bacterium]